MSKTLFSFAIFAFLALTPMAASAETPDDECKVKDALENCLDGIKESGQHDDADYAPNLPANLRATQKHGVVRLDEASYIFAYNRCRWVDNLQSKGPVFIGLETRQEWIGHGAKGGFSDQPAPGTALEPCCIPVQVNICGKTKNIDFQKVGYSKVYHAGHSRTLTVRCVGNTAGINDTEDTSWTRAFAGQCDAPPPSNNDDCYFGNHCDGNGSGGSGDGKEHDGYHDKAGDGNTGGEHTGGGSQGS